MNHVLVLCAGTSWIGGKKLRFFTLGDNSSSCSMGLSEDAIRRGRKSYYCTFLFIIGFHTGFWHGVTDSDRLLGVFPWEGFSGLVTILLLVPAFLGCICTLALVSPLF